jgi:hypothetical protein
VSAGAAGALARDQAKVAGEAPARWETGRIADESDQGRGAQKADAGDGAQPRDCGKDSRESFQLTLDQTEVAIPVQEHAGTGGSLRSLRPPLNAGLLDGGRRSTATAWTTRFSALETSRQHPLSCERRYSKSKQHRNVTRGKS